MTYEEQLQDERWKLKREDILRRDWWMCQQCMSTKNLQVHHKKYLPDLMAWEYEDKCLITLCKDCHTMEHERVYVSRPKSIRDVITDWALQMSGR